MEPNKIEKQFREKLNSREIQPTAQAWDRLDAMLSVAEEKKTKRPFGFLFIAASILVFVTLGMFLFMGKDSKIEPQKNVVETTIKKDTTRNPIKNNNAPMIGVEKQNEVATSSEQQSTSINHQSSNNKSIINQKTTVNQKGNDNQNQIIKDKAIEFQNSSDVALKDLPRIETRREIIVENKKEVKSDESLLADLDNVAKKSANQKSTLKVDAKSLLSQADGEVEYTFREKVLNKVSKNYKEVKVALANRNKE
ncbi:hypothetical protein [Flavobacterium sp. N1994]|uniref:hypothetical protein n=1 Tax=Flavobacterium sp. N1994 TaxID=2986827 RepID=UPI002222FBA1|nr:hypothetical protein [Flavobacterium sp. N1994]